MLVGGAPITDATAQAGRAAFGDVLHQAFGQTEAVPLTVMTPQEWFGSYPGSQPMRSAGRLLPFARMQVRDDDGAVLPLGSEGELWAQVEGQMHGFWGAEELTGSRLVDGWVRTRDIGRIDENGFVYVLDRADDMIVSGGFNIWPAELETVIADHPAVVEVAVFAVPHERWGVEELATVDSSLAVTVHVQAICVSLLAHLASDRPELLERILPEACTGERFIAVGLTEPTGGSDAGNIATSARADGDDDWVISGAKQFITNSGTPFSRYVILLAAVERSTSGRPPVSAFLVPLDAPGVTVGPAYPKAGWRSSDTHPLFFDDVRVPAEALLSEPGRGYRDVLEFLTWARFPIAAMSAGLARGCLTDCLRFVDGRTSFGRDLGSHQGVAFPIAQIAALASAARTMTYDGAWKYDHGRPIRDEAAVAKLVASEMAVEAANLATQVQGGYGFIEAATRHHQDARILTIGEGTSEVQRMLIARSLGLSV